MTSSLIKTTTAVAPDTSSRISSSERICSSRARNPFLNASGRFPWAEKGKMFTLAHSIENLLEGTGTPNHKPDSFAFLSLQGRLCSGTLVPMAKNFACSHSWLHSQQKTAYQISFQSRHSSLKCHPAQSKSTMCRHHFTSNVLFKDYIYKRTPEHCVAIFFTSKKKNIRKKCLLDWARWNN